VARMKFWAEAGFAEKAAALAAETRREVTGSGRALAAGPGGA